MESSQIAVGPEIVTGTGEGLIIILSVSEFGHNKGDSYSVTIRVPLPAEPQLTVTELVPLPPVIVPPAICHEYEEPGLLVVVYTAPVLFSQTGFGPEMTGVGSGTTVICTVATALGQLRLLTVIVSVTWGVSEGEEV